MEYIYTVVDDYSGAFPEAFTSYADAYAATKRTYKDYWPQSDRDDYWGQQQEEEDIEEGTNIDKEEGDDGYNPNVTQIQIWIDMGRTVTIYRLKIKR
jgi:hypothetical protein